MLSPGLSTWLELRPFLSCLVQSRVMIIQWQFVCKSLYQRFLKPSELTVSSNSFTEKDASFVNFDVVIDIKSFTTQLLFCPYSSMWSKKCWIFFTWSLTLAISDKSLLLPQLRFYNSWSKRVSVAFIMLLTLSVSPRSRSVNWFVYHLYRL